MTGRSPRAVTMSVWAIAALLLVGLYVGLLFRAQQANRIQGACAAALDDYRDTLRLSAQALGQKPDWIPDRSANRIGLDLQVHEQECRG